MGLIKRSNGFYYVRIIRNGKLKTLSLKTKNKILATELYQSYLVYQIQPELFSSKLSLNINNNSTELNHEKVIQLKKESNSYDRIWVEYFQTNNLNNLSKSQLGIKKQVYQHLNPSKTKNVLL